MNFSPASTFDPELERWSRIFSGSAFYYGEDPGPVARRCVRYHRPILRTGGKALDAGCGEGQDLAFLAQSGYDALGVDFTPQGTQKARAFLAQKALQARVECADLRFWNTAERFHLVLAVNCLQFLGAEAMPTLDKLMQLTAPRGVLGLSLFAREAGPGEPGGAVQDTLYFATLRELLEKFSDWQPFEASQLWQWNGGGPQPFVTLIAQKK